MKTDKTTPSSLFSIVVIGVHRRQRNFSMERSSLMSLRQASFLSRKEPRPHLREAPARPLFLHHRASLEEYAISDPDTPMGAIRFLRLKPTTRGPNNQGLDEGILLLSGSQQRR